MHDSLLKCAISFKKIANQDVTILPAGTIAASNLVYCADLFKFAAISDVLTALNVSDEIKQYVLSQPKDRMNHCIIALEKNKNIKSVNELEAAVNELLQSADKFDINAVKFWLGQYYEEPAGQWALDNLRKLRKNNPILDSEKFYKIFPAWFNFVGWVSDTNANALLGEGLLTADLQFSRQSFLDWYRALVTKESILSMSIGEVAQQIRNWHEIQAQLGEGEKYQEGTTNIVYGPKWHNPAFNGWTIKKITTENDLQVEGNKMNHCVGGYCEHVESGNSIIYSLRDSKNEPHVTMEGNPKYSYVEPRDWSSHQENPDYQSPKKEITNIDFNQIYGNSNSEPKKEYKEMIKEWFQSLMKSGKKIEAVKGDDINERIYEAAESFKYNHSNDWLDKLLLDENEYGIPVSNSNYSFSSAYDSILKGFANRNNNYYGAMGYAAEPLIRLAIEEDIRTADEYDKKFTYTYVQKLQLSYQKNILNIIRNDRHDSENTNIRKSPDAYSKQDKKIAEDQAIREIKALWTRNSEIEFITNKIQENNEVLFDSVMDNYPTMPEESDFEDPEDYKRAYKDYEDQVEYIDKDARQYLPYAFDDDLMKELHKQLASKPIALRPWMEGSTVWHYSNEKQRETA